MGIYDKAWKLALLALTLSLAIHAAATCGYLMNFLIMGRNPLSDPRALSFLDHGFLIQILELSSIFFVALGASEFYRYRLKENLTSISGEPVATAALLSMFFAWAMIPYFSAEDPQSQVDRSIASD